MKNKKAALGEPTQFVGTMSPLCAAKATSAQTTPPSEPGFINEKELLKRLPVSRRTAFSWQKNGKLPTVKIGRRKIFHWPSVEAALLRQQRGGDK